MLERLVEFFRTVLSPQLLVPLLTGWLGYGILFAIVFAETGLLLGFFLPGDSLLFTVGVAAGAGRLNIFWVNVLLMAAAIIGDTVGYLLGRHTGPRIFSRPDSRLFHRDHLLRTQAFYEKHGGKTIVYARFIPIIRTFAPFVAGVAGMNYARFISFNVFGGIGWVFSMTMLGYTLGSIPIVQQHFEKVILLIIAVSVAPILVHYLSERRKRRRPARTKVSR
ncbi:MAG: hypothetical protein FJW37_04945 [Acidobacteria bacterium]|nr:hypothetical protein [Acidobacteriota bacterium]